MENTAQSPEQNPKESPQIAMLYDEELENPEHLKNPYSREPVLAHISIENFTSAELEEKKLKSIDIFDHFFLYFVHSFEALQAKQKHSPENSWIDYVSDFIHQELKNMENAAMSFEFTSAWVLKYCLDQLLVNQKQISNLKLQRDQVRKKFIEFIDENMIDLMACAISKDFDMLEHILEDRLGRYQEDHLHVFLRKSVAVCRDTALQKELQECEESQQQARTFSQIEESQWGEQPIQTAATETLQRSNVQQREAQSILSKSTRQANDLHANFQIAKATLLLKQKKYLEAYLIVRQLQSQSQKTLNSSESFHDTLLTPEQVMHLKQLQLMLEQLEYAEEKDPLQLLIFDLLSGKITRQSEIEERIAFIDLTDNVRRELRGWLLIAKQLFGELNVVDFLDDSISSPRMHGAGDQILTKDALNQAVAENKQNAEEKKQESVESEVRACSAEEMFQSCQGEAQLDAQSILALCLDGGGIRGIIQLIMLAELEARTGKKCHEIFNFFAGTSIGGIISMALASGTSAEHLLYDFLGRTRNKIFSQRHYLRYIIGLRCDGEHGILSHSLYNKQGIEEELMHFFQENSMRSISHNVLITSCALEGGKMRPYIFVKFTKENGEIVSGRSLVKGLRPSRTIDNSCEGVKVREIARASSAAYPFIAATEILGTQYVDGGFLFNNVDILLLNFLAAQGVQKNNIKILSLGNFPSDNGVSSNKILYANTMLMGIATTFKNILNPETYYQDYFTLAANNFENSVSETRETLGQNYTRLEPEYDGQFIALDSTSPESLKLLKQIGANWIEKLNYSGDMARIIEEFIEKPQTEANSIAVIPRYYSYRYLYKSIEDGYANGEWKKHLLDFQFPREEMQIVHPRSCIESFASYFRRHPENNDICLLTKAAAIGHIPTLKHILKSYTQEQRESLIKQAQVNNWNALHYSAANGEISAFIYLVSQILQTSAFFPESQRMRRVPQRVQKALNDLKWQALKENLQTFLTDRDAQSLPFSNKYAPFFNFFKTTTINLAEENNQLSFKTVMNYLLQD